MLPEGLIFENESFIKPGHSVKLLVILPHPPQKVSESSLLFRFTCHGLATGQSYIFRVRAVNAAGLSEYSQDSEAIEVKAAIGKLLLYNLAEGENELSNSPSSL